MSTSHNLKDSNENNFKYVTGKKKPLGDLKLNIPGPSKNETEISRRDKILKKTVQDLCKNEMQSIIKIPNLRPKSASCIKQDDKFNFDILMDKKCKGNSIKRKKIKSEINKIGEVPIIDKENKPNNVISLEKQWDERRLNRQRSQLEGKVCCRRRLHSESSSTKAVEQLENHDRIQSKPVACRKPIRTLVNIVRINSGRVSPIRRNPLASENVLISRVRNEPKMKRRDSARSSTSSNCDNGFNEESLQDILKMEKVQEQKILLPKHFLFIFNHNSKHRSIVVNWMFWIQDLFNIPDAEVYIAVSLLDQVLARIAVPKNMYQLVALTCIILSNKFMGSDELVPLHFLGLVNNVYTRYQIYKMEKKLLKLLDFNIHSIEPTVYVNAYLKLAHLDPASGEYFDIFFCLDHALHLSSYSSTPTSLVAIAAMSVAFNTFENINLQKLIIDLYQELRADEAALCITMQALIVDHIKKHNEPIHIFDIMRKYKDCAWKIKTEQDQ